jgi:hypothetical protein
MTTATVVPAVPYDLTRFIETQQRDICNSNQADHKPTYQAELDQEKRAITEGYDRGVRWLATLDPKTVQRCRALYEHRQKKSGWRMRPASEFAWYPLKGVGHLVVYRYMGMYEEVLELCAVLEVSS